MRCLLLTAAAALLMTAPPSGPAHAAKVDVPIQVGIAPAVHWLTGPVANDQILMGGLKLYVAAVIDQDLIRRNINRVPKKYQAQAAKMTEVRYSPLWYLPDTLFLSPKVERTQMWGIAFRPIAIGLTLTQRPRLSAAAGLLITYAYVGSDDPALGETHFLRPGIDIKLDFEIPITKRFLISLGWASQFYIPQKVNAGVFDLGGIDESIWHIGQGYLMLHFRFDYPYNL